MKMLISHDCGTQFYGGSSARYCVECKEKRWTAQNHRADKKAYEREKRKHESSRSGGE